MLYSQLKEELYKIKENQGYSDISKAFAHWYLLEYLNIDENDIGEMIIDGYGDNGIDAIVYREDTNLMELYQFKFPNSINNISGKIDEKTGMKLTNGFNKLMQIKKPKVSNPSFEYYWEKVKNEQIFNYKFIFVVFHDGFSDSCSEHLSNFIDDYKGKTGSSIELHIFDKKRICEIIESKKGNNLVDINLKYKLLYSGYSIEDNVKSEIGFTSSKDILEAIENYMNVIFDENIRNYEGDNEVNKGIVDTATNDKEFAYFYFYHNGVVFICNDYSNSPGSQTIKINGASIVNGCQTIMCLKKAKEQKPDLNDKVIVPIRIISTKDFELRAKITEYLNSQTKIKDSYFLSNNIIIRNFQEKLFEKQYFLERLANEYSYKKMFNSGMHFDKEHILQLEKTIQIYVAYYKDESAHTAKSAKSVLFNKNGIDELIKDIDVDRFLKALNIYRKICEKITLYRKCRRSLDKNEEFLNYIGDNVGDFNDQMKSYVFMNTADLLLLNGYHSLTSDDFNDKSFTTLVKLCKEVIDKNKNMLPSTATKNSSVFKELREACKQNQRFIPKQY